MNTASLTRQFERIGAEIKIETIAVGAEKEAKTPARRLALREGYGIDIVTSRKREGYTLIVREDMEPTLEITALDIQPQIRHLLLLARTVDEDGVPLPGNKNKFLCGHDERHWFVAAPDRTVSTVHEAMEALKPQGVARIQHRLGVRTRDWNRRRNAAFIRQGEWFFLPQPEYEPGTNVAVLRDEPLRRSNGGKPHLIEFLIRDGGEAVWVAPQTKMALVEAQYRRLLERRPETRSWNWSLQRRNPRVYARGKVRHADHATIYLPLWHQVLMNTEQVVTANGRISANVAFID